MPDCGSRTLSPITLNLASVSVAPDRIARAHRGLRDDPEAGTNHDVLLHLANDAGAETTWAGSRRLPEAALRRRERHHAPQH